MFFLLPNRSMLRAKRLPRMRMPILTAQGRGCRARLRPIEAREHLAPTANFTWPLAQPT